MQNTHTYIEDIKRGGTIDFHVVCDALEMIDFPRAKVHEDE